MCSLDNAASSTSFRASDRLRLAGWAGSDGEVGSGEMERLDDLARPIILKQRVAAARLGCCCCNDDIMLGGRCAIHGSGCLGGSS